LQRERPEVIGVGLLSGGLDSILAARVLQNQGIHVIGVTFSTPFFGPEAVLQSAKTLAIPFHVLDIATPHLEMLKHPRYGYGSQMNPCIDCHALMLREAGRFMDDHGGHFLFTGEVVGQRPMSQRRDALRSVENLAGYPGRVLRPLSAKLLPPTRMELDGLVDRERLLDIQGRSRKRQQVLAAAFGITDYPQPGGGCMLTKEGFSRKLRRLLQQFPHATPREVEMLKWGRQYLLPGGSLCFVGRNEGDNHQLELLGRGYHVVLDLAEVPGPIGVLLAGPNPDEDLSLAARIVVAYSDAAEAREIDVVCHHPADKGSIPAFKQGKDTFRTYLVS
jgi:tRNA-uridine 2-sulfurtransferase